MRRRDRAIDSDAAQKKAALPHSMRGSEAQRETITVVPTDTRWYRSDMSAFNMRMQP